MKYNCTTDGHRLVFSHFCDVYGNVGFCVECERYSTSLDHCYEHPRPIDKILSRHLVADPGALKLT